MRIFLALFLLLSQLNSGAQSSELTWSAYDTSGTLQLKNFSSLTKTELEFAGFLPDFKENRSRLTLTDGKNRISPRELQKPDFPMPCHCIMKNDTIVITTAMGIMSGLGLITTITKNRFATSFFHEADNTNIFKLKKTDSIYMDRISVSTAEQRLTLLKKPLFKTNEIIIGEFKGKFKTFYELDLGDMLTRNYHAKLFFKCRLR